MVRAGVGVAEAKSSLHQFKPNGTKQISNKLGIYAFTGAPHSLKNLKPHPTPSPTHAPSSVRYRVGQGPK